MNGTQLATTDEERDIGVVISKSLKPASQCNIAAGRTTTVLNQIKRNFHFRDRNTCLRLYKQYVRPHLEFAGPAWAPWLKSDIEVLEKVQEKAVKMVSGLRSKEYADRCAELGLETLEKQRQNQDMGLVYKFLNGEEESNLFTLADRPGAMRTRQEQEQRALWPNLLEQTSGNFHSQ
jgi:hypothetical protein